MPRREVVLDAAIAVLGRDGLRGLTHRTVDREAALPEGSTSNLCRTRDALVDGIAERLAERDRELWAKLACRPVRGRADLVELIAVWCHVATTDDAALAATRYALFLAARSRPSLRTALEQARRGLEVWAAEILAQAGEPVQPKRVAEALDLVDGLILHQLCFPAPDFDPQPTLHRILDPR